MAMQVRCACRQLKSKMRCADARQLAAARHQPAPVEGAAAALLDCDAKCQQRIKVGPGCHTKLLCQWRALLCYWTAMPRASSASR